MNVKRAAAGAVIVLAGSLAVAFAAHSSADASGVTIAREDSTNAAQASAVEAVARRVLINHWQIGLPKDVLKENVGRLNSAPSSSVSKAVNSPAAPAAASEISAAKVRTEANFSADLARAEPAFAERERNTFRNVSAALEDPRQRLLGSGVSRISVTRTSISENTATVEGTFSAWSCFQMLQSDGRWIQSCPAGDDQFTVDLEKVGGKWYVVNYVSRPLPGSLP